MMNWIPIDECPEEWKDGRNLLAARRTPKGHWRYHLAEDFYHASWLRYAHVALITPPEDKHGMD